MKQLLSEVKKVLELSISKCLTGAKLSDKEIKQIMNVSENDLMRLHKCDFIMVEKIKTHARQELNRQRAQNLYNRNSDYKSDYPKKPYTRTKPIAESKNLLEFSDKDMVDYITHELSGDSQIDAVITVNPTTTTQIINANPHEGLLQKRLSQYLGMVRAMELWYHSAHHASRGTSFSGDHPNLFGDFYSFMLSEADAVIEKAVGTTNNEEMACPRKITSIALTVLSKYPTPVSTSSLATGSTALQIENDYIQLVTEIFKELDDAKLLSLGWNDFLMSSVNSHESHIYKLQQRVKTDLEN